MRTAARLGLALTLVVSMGCASSNTNTLSFAPGAHDNTRLIYVDERCNVTPPEAWVEYQPAGAVATPRQRLEVSWVIDKDDDLTAEIVTKATNPEVQKLFDREYQFPERVKEKKSGKVKEPPVFQPGESVGWPYSVTIGSPGDPRYCHVDPKICIRNPDGSSTCR